MTFAKTPVIDLAGVFFYLKGQKLDDFIDLYKNDETLSSKLQQLKQKVENGETLKKEVREAFKGYHAHVLLSL